MEASMSTRVVRDEIVVTEPLVQSFYRKTVKSDSGCIIWAAAVDRTGYGKCKIDGVVLNAHVAAWRIANGGANVPIGHVVMHTCECRLCVNPEHLEAASQSVNMKHAHADQKLDDFQKRGQECHNAVLSEDVVREILGMHVPRKMGAVRISRLLGVSRSCIDAVLRRRNWRHVDAG
jgi:hypothetical protein